MSAIHMPLDKAYLCADCEEVGNDSRQCACCQSKSLMVLASVLNRKTIAYAYEVERALWAVEVAAKS